jgi:hypothetical protein
MSDVIRWVDYPYSTGAILRIDRFHKISAWYDSARSKGSDEKPFIASYNGEQLKTRFDEFEEAKAFALKHAKYFLNNALSKLEEFDGNA